MNQSIYKGTLALGAVAAISLLSACGGGGADAGTSPFNTNSGTATPTETAASTVILSLDKSSVLNTDATAVSATALVIDSSGKVLPNVPVTFRVSGALFTTTASVTGSDGTVKASVIFSQDKSNRLVDVVASVPGVNGTLQTTQSFVVSGARISSTATQTIVSPGDASTIEFLVQDASGTAIVNKAITAELPTGQVLSSTTNSSGKASFNITVPAGYAQSEFVVKASAAGASDTETLAVQLGGGTVTIPQAAAVPQSTLVEIDPAVIGTNSPGSTINQSATIRFKAFDSSSRPIRNVRVAFDLLGDPNSIGGTISSGSNVVYTDGNGIASATYTPGATATGTNGLTIRACYSRNDFAPNPAGNSAAGTVACPAAASQELTINNEALNITVGPDDGIAETSDGLRYVHRFVVQVANASGQAKAGVKVTPTLDLLGFLKGSWNFNTAQNRWVQTVTNTAESYPDPEIPSISYVGCANEDVNRNGINNAGEDLDGDTRLEPRKSDATVSLLSSSDVTDSTGAVAFQVTYLKNVASWLRIKLAVKGSVSGTEGTGTFEEVLPVPGSVLTNANNTPAFADNPYGESSVCTSH